MTSPSIDQPDPQQGDGLRAVSGWPRALSKGDPTAFFGQLVRQSIDEVVDGPRTGRWDLEQLDSTEKTYAALRETPRRPDQTRIRTTGFTADT